MGDGALPRVAGTSSGISDLTQLVSTILGQKQTSSQSGETGPLYNLINQIQQQSQGQGEALLSSIFSKAAGAIPGIMGNTFNATGSRQDGGNMPAPLQKLLQDTVLQGQGQLVQQQTNNNQLIGNAAAAIANATKRGTTQTQVSGRDTLAKLGQVVGASKLAKNLTGYDPIKELTGEIQSLINGGGTGIPVSGFAGNDMAVGAANAFGGVADSGVINSANSLLTGDLGTSLNDAGQALMSYFADPGAATSAASAATEPAAITMPNLSLGGGDTATSFGNTDAANFSMGGSSNTGGTTSQEAGQYLTALNYLDKPKSIKDIFDFSDGDWKDDIGDITDAASIAFPPAALVRPALNIGDATASSVDDFVHNPGQWFDDLFSGNNAIVNSIGDTLTGTVQNLENLGQGVINVTEDAVNSVGDFFGDIFGW